MTRTMSDASGHPILFDVFDARCPSHEAMRDVTGRWAPLVLLALHEGNTRFSELRRRIDGTSDRMLSQTLRTLEADGLVDRVLEAPNRPSYSLTPGGRRIAGHLAGLRGALYDHLHGHLSSTEPAEV